ncbi:MAG: hypothetical protein HYT12_02320 [Candidatus Liptonbacteria bacterium]|nr:hypothetical protein [Candidatus Liptonbacteria bacterium]
MGRKKKHEEENEEGGLLNMEIGHFFELHPDAKKSVVAVLFAAIAIILILSSLGKAGPAGNAIFQSLSYLFGWGYYLAPVTMFLAAFIFLITKRQRVLGITIFGSFLLFLSSLGIIDIVSPKSGGLLGSIIGIIEAPFGYMAALVLTGAFFIASLIATLNTPIKIKNPFARGNVSSEDEVLTPEEEENIEAHEKDDAESEEDGEEAEDEEEEARADEENAKQGRGLFGRRKKSGLAAISGDYTPPPLSLLKTSTEKPTSGDLRANANIIKRTLESFGIAVEMGEINVGPKVTRYTLKPAEGVKISKINALNQDLALALAAHPIRIEAPIPGKSLVGIEVPNKAAAVVRLGSLMNYKEFSDGGMLDFVLGRDVTGNPVFSDIAKMPHLLVAGATGSGKSVMLHTLILCLLYKNSPETLRMIMIDPKRVELSVYNGMPHLIAPVVTDGKKTVAVFRWTISEMERRYGLLEAAGSRDIKSFNVQNKKEALPYIVIIIDELADLMAAYGREIEGSIVRIAQMARATGIHLIVATQRPSVEVITGLIKANITTRIALQVASQVDSRTILDSAGAEKLLGGGDLLFISAEFSKPKRIQGAYVSEDEIRIVANFIREKNSDLKNDEEIEFANQSTHEIGNDKDVFDEFSEDGNEEDLMYGDAVEVVREAGKASASLLQRRLKVGYARAARLLDIMEARGIIGPGDGAKPREVYLNEEV